MITEMTGKQFGRLTVIKRDGYQGTAIMWSCVCFCGKTTRVRGGHLRDGRIKSCGCLNSEMTKTRSTTHGRTRTPEHRTWVNIRARCGDPKHISYKYYGAKGVKVSPQWDAFSTFLRDMGMRPSKDHSIDRIDPDGDYAPGNCRWATEIEQQNNRRNTKWITLYGDTHSESEWCRIRGFRAQVIGQRLRRGWSIRDAIWKPLR